MGMVEGCSKTALAPKYTQPYGLSWGLEFIIPGRGD